MSFNRAFFFFFFKHFFLFLKEPIVSITWTIHPELSSFPPSPSFTSTHVMQHHFRAEFCKEEGYLICLGGRKVKEELVYSFIFCHFPVKDCKDSSYERIWRLNMIPWHTQVVMQWQGRGWMWKCEETIWIQNQLPLSCQLITCPFGSLNLSMKFVPWKNCILTSLLCIIQAQILCFFFKLIILNFSSSFLN